MGSAGWERVVGPGPPAGPRPLSKVAASARRLIARQAQSAMRVNRVCDRSNVAYPVPDLCARVLDDISGTTETRTHIVCTLRNNQRHGKLGEEAPPSRRLPEPVRIAKRPRPRALGPGPSSHGTYSRCGHLNRSLLRRLGNPRTGAACTALPATGDDESAAAQELSHAGATDSGRHRRDRAVSRSLWPCRRHVT